MDGPGLTESDLEPARWLMELDREGVVEVPGAGGRGGGLTDSYGFEEAMDS